jgi:DNA-binding transcriptional MerR regulator
MDDGFTIRTHWLAGELAKAAGVSTDTLRHYERKGVLKRPRRAQNGYRLYPESALKQILLVRRALSVGFTLDELARILSEREKGDAPCRKARQLLAEKLLNVEEQLNALAVLRDELSLTLADWDRRLLTASVDTQVGLLETLADKNQSLPPAKERKGNHNPNLKSKKRKVENGKT